MAILNENIQKLHDNNQIFYQVYRGSYVYGTYIEGRSDKDIGGIYMSDFNDVLGFGYKQQVSDEKGDTVFYDIKRFLELAQINNPSILELMFTPEKFHIYKHPLMNLILDNKDKFLTKLCEKALLGYAYEQIKKAKGLDKKMNWEKKRVERKTVLDCCFVPNGYKTLSVTDWLTERNMKQEYCGLVNLPHMHNIYAIFYDFNKHLEVEKSLNKKWVKFNELLKPQYNCSVDLKYKGIIQKGEQSNDISLSEIPIGEVEVCYMSFNKDDYSRNCKDFKEYQEWQLNVNRERLVDVQNHGQKIDGKNMLHCVRLIKTVEEIADGKGLIIERPDAQELLKIRRGEVDLQSLIEWSEEKLSSISSKFANSGLPDSVDPVFVNDLLIEIRREYYKVEKKSFFSKMFDNNLLKSFVRSH